jgi:hypothetical protein
MLSNVLRNGVVRHQNHLLGELNKMVQVTTREALNMSALEYQCVCLCCSVHATWRHVTVARNCFHPRSSGFVLLS